MVVLVEQLSSSHLQDISAVTRKKEKSNRDERRCNEKVFQFHFVGNGCVVSLSLSSTTATTTTTKIVLPIACKNLHNCSCCPCIVGVRLTIQVVHCWQRVGELLVKKNNNAKPRLPQCVCSCCCAYQGMSVVFMCARPTGHLPKPTCYCRIAKRRRKPPVPPTTTMACCSLVLSLVLLLYMWYTIASLICSSGTVALARWLFLTMAFLLCWGNVGAVKKEQKSCLHIDSAEKTVSTSSNNHNWQQQILTVFPQMERVSNNKVMAWRHAIGGAKNEFPVFGKRMYESHSRWGVWAVVE